MSGTVAVTVQALVMLYAVYLTQRKDRRRACISARLAVQQSALWAVMAAVLAVILASYKGGQVADDAMHFAAAAAAITTGIAVRVLAGKRGG